MNVTLTRLAVLMQTGGWRWVRWLVEALAVAAAWLTVYADYDNQRVAACPAGDCSATLHPIIGVVVTVAVLAIEAAVLVMSRRRSLKICPDCAESVMADARVCKHCGHRFDAAIAPLA